MAFLSKLKGAAQGLVAGYKNGGNIEEALKTTELIINSYLKPIKNKNAGRLPNSIFADSYLIGFLCRYAALYLRHCGIKEQFLINRGITHTVSKALNIQPDFFIEISKNMNDDDMSSFELGIILADKTFQGFLTDKQTAMNEIATYLCNLYGASNYDNE